MTAKVDGVRGLWISLLDLIFPPRCGGCGKRGVWFCSSCEQILSLPSYLPCLVCGRPAIQGFTHFKCQKRVYPERLLPAYRYEGRWRKAILRLKYKGEKVLASDLSSLAWNSWQAQGLTIVPRTVLIPVPLHPVRERQRGFNQSYLLAKGLSEIATIPLVSLGLRRVRKTAPQVGLTRKGRLENLKGVFKCPRPELVSGKEILLIDDVVTTGATLLEAGRVLKKAGADKVTALALAFEEPRSF